MSGTEKLAKLARFVRIYGPGRTLYKASGRLRLGGVGFMGRRHERTIGIIGYGQFAFATIGYFLSRQRGAGIAACYDPDAKAAETFARFYRMPTPAPDAAALIADPAVKIVYIASNHASHADYAIAALERGLTVYCEKPVAVTEEQLIRLAAAERRAPGRLFAGYNRPFSAVIDLLRNACGGASQPMTLSCFISGHVLAADHWYRKPEEGTRVCGNVGHWLDLAVHMLSWSGTLADRWQIALNWSNPDARDDDVAITLTSERQDLINIVLTARSEPFEGINETINFQQGGIIAKIDDFRACSIWKGRSLVKKRFWPKDVGHRRAILQPFGAGKRDWREVELSTLLMLHITSMVREGRSHGDFSFSGATARLDGAAARHTAKGSA